jgi:uncharacterized membrane protein
MKHAIQPPGDVTARPPRLAIAALGFALGGFFDGILLHQILQWHHLLSAVQGAGTDLRFLVMTDGLFHLAMYAVALAGLWGLRRARKRLVPAGAGRQVIAWSLIGFGTWHVTDAVLSHWLLGIHRIRMDSEMPLLWDLVWLAAFGLLPLAIGLAFRRGERGGGDSGSGHAARATWLLAALTTGSALVQALPPPSDAPVIVMFRNDLSSAEAMAAIVAVDGRLAGHDPTGTLWAVELPPQASPAALYLHGALLVSRAGGFVGCLDYTRLPQA